MKKITSNLVPVLALTVCFLAMAFHPRTTYVPALDKALQKIVIYDGITGLGQWYVCDKSKTTVYEKDKRVITYINKSTFECFGVYFDPVDMHRSSHISFSGSLETNYKDDSVALYVSFFDTAKRTSNFKKLKVTLKRGNLQQFRLPLDDLIIKELKMDFSKINSVLFYVESKKEEGYWGNVVLKDIVIQ
ncbi:MAG TPA: hypothetical protein PK509_15905 [Catalimonadaceae bacterium]|nr:hypothetical protein [Catalimonadaceae bacterium]